MPAREYEFYLRVFNSRLHKHTNDDVFDDFPRFPTAFRRLPKIFQNCSEDQRNTSEHFPHILRRLPKIAEDDRRRSEDVSIIHPRI